jgi:integrase
MFLGACLLPKYTSWINCPIRDFPQADLWPGDWLTAGGVTNGRLFRRVCRAGRVWGEGITEKVVWHVVKEYAAKIGVSKLAPHDLRRSCARLCHEAGGELEQIQFLLGHVSVQTTEKYLGCKQRLRGAVNDRIGIEPDS